MEKYSTAAVLKKVQEDSKISIDDKIKTINYAISKIGPQI